MSLRPLVAYCEKLHGTTLDQAHRWRVADLPDRMAVPLVETDGPPVPFSAVLWRRGKPLVLISKRVLESPLGPDAIAGACARVWFLRHGLTAPCAYVGASAARLAIPEALVRAVHRGAYRRADVASIVGCPLELVYLRMALDTPALPAQHEAHVRWVTEGLRCLGGRCLLRAEDRRKPRGRDCAEVAWSTPGV
jgi:hypothetical protein